jgi:hypothetical protein
VFSDAGGTGGSYHADNNSASKKARRSHYLAQAGWRADKAIQGLGRSHRTNQASAPIFHLVTTDLDGQKRFISSIARRLGQLGALTKGQRQAGDQGVFSQRDNLESREAQDALSQFYGDLLHDRLPISVDEFEKQTGLALRIKDDEGRVTGIKQELPPITTFLNRLLSLKVDLQNKVFQAFSDRLDAVIDARQQAGLLDAGLETIRADKITKDHEQVVHTDKESGAQTKYVKLTLANRFVPTPFDTVAKSAARPVKFWATSPQGRVYGVTQAPHLTDADGRIIEKYRVTGPSSSRTVGQDDVDHRGSKWQKIDKAQAEQLWQTEIDKAPEFISRDEHLVTGTILPIWDRLKGNPRVVRLQTDDGERLIGRVIPMSSVAETLKALGAEAKAANVKPQDIHARILAGGRATLANGWTLKRSLVAGEQRIELTGPENYSEGQQVKADGAFTEKINYSIRYFIPTEPEAGAKAIAAITEHRPVVEFSGGGEPGGAEGFAEGGDHFANPAATPDNIRDAIKRALDADDGYHYGLRVTEAPLSVGERAPPSKTWYSDFISEDHPTFGREEFPDHNTELPGTSTIKLRSPEDIEYALMAAGVTPMEYLKANKGHYRISLYHGRYVSLLRSKEAIRGNDPGEAILPDADVVGAWDKGEGFAEGTAPNAAGYTNLGHFMPSPREDAQIARQAQDYVLARGRATGNEHLLAIDENGRVIEHGEGGVRNIAISDNLRAAVLDPRNSISAHHNHPSNGPLSLSDLALTAWFYSVWAHGHAGRVSRAALTDAARRAFANIDRSEAPALFKRVITGIARPIFDFLQGAIDDGRITPLEATHAYAHAIALALHRAGVIDYRTNMTMPKAVAAIDIDPYINNAALRAAGAVTHVRPDAMAVGGRAEPLRHKGDVGATFEVAPGQSQGPDAQTVDRRGRAGAGQEAALGEAGGFEEFRNPFRRAPPTLAQRLGNTRGAKTVENLYDLSHRVKLLQTEMERLRGGAMTDSEGFYNRKRLYPGRLSEAHRGFDAEHLDPTEDALKRYRISHAAFGDFLTARHAGERNAAIGQLHPHDHQFYRAMFDPDVVGASGMSLNQARAIFDAALAADNPKRPGFLEAARRHDAMRNFVLALRERSGLESRQTIEEWRNRYQHYADLSGFEDETAEESTEQRDAAKFNVRGPESRRALGRASRSANPYLNMLNQAHRTMERAERNRYLQSLATALRDFGPHGIPDIVTFAEGKTTRALDRTTGLVKEVPDRSHINDPKGVAYKTGGATRYLVFKDRGLAEAVKRMHPDELTSFLGSVLKVENKIKSLWTHYSPEFLARHFLFRYPIEGALNSFEQKDIARTRFGGNLPPGATRHSVARYVADSIPFMGAAYRAIRAVRNDATAPDTHVGQLMRDYEEMRREGGAMAFRARRDIALLPEHLELRLRESEGSRLAKLRIKYRYALEAMDGVTNALDNSLRLAAYHSARKSGLTPQQAARIAQDATVDFQLAGRWAPALSLMWPFSKVANSTAARMIGAIGRSRWMKGVAGGMLGAGFLLGMYNYLVGGKDKDGVPFFDKLSDWEQRNHFTFFVPGVTDSKGRPQPVKIALPYGMGGIFSLGTAMARQAFGTYSTKDNLAFAFGAMLQSLTPWGEEHSLTGIMAPELLRPLAHISANTSWTGRSVHADPLMQSKINAESGFKGTAEPWKWAARAANAATGGTSAKPGLIDPHPEDIKELLEYVAGAQLRLGEHVFEAGQSISRQKLPQPSETPLLREFFGTDYDLADTMRANAAKAKQKHPALR